MKMNKELRFDICEAWYLYAVLYHSGQSSKLYQKIGQLDRMGFRPAPGLCYDSLQDDGKRIFEDLVRTKKYQ
jgi:hypothetical protein